MAPRGRPPASSRARYQAQQEQEQSTRRNHTHLARNPDLNGTSDISSTPTDTLLVRPLYPTTGARALGKRVLQLLEEGAGVGKILGEELVLRRAFIVRGSASGKSRGYGFLELGGEEDAIQAINLLNTLDPADLTIGSERVCFDFAKQGCLFQPAQTQTKVEGDAATEDETGKSSRHWVYWGGARDSYASAYTFPQPKGAEFVASGRKDEEGDTVMQEERVVEKTSGASAAKSLGQKDDEGDTVMQEEDAVGMGSGTNSAKNAGQRDTETEPMRAVSGVPEALSMGPKDVQGDTVMHQGASVLKGTSATASPAKKKKKGQADSKSTTKPKRAYKKKGRPQPLMPLERSASGITDTTNTNAPLQAQSRDPPSHQTPPQPEHTQPSQLTQPLNTLQHPTSSIIATHNALLQAQLQAQFQTPFHVQNQAHPGHQPQPEPPSSHQEHFTFCRGPSYQRALPDSSTATPFMDSRFNPLGIIGGFNPIGLLPTLEENGPQAESRVTSVPAIELAAAGVGVGVGDGTTVSTSHRQTPGAAHFQDSGAVDGAWGARYTGAGLIRAGGDGTVGGISAEVGDLSRGATASPTVVGEARQTNVAVPPTIADRPEAHAAAMASAPQMTTSSLPVGFTGTQGFQWASGNPGIPSPGVSRFPTQTPAPHIGAIAPRTDLAPQTGFAASSTVAAHPSMSRHPEITTTNVVPAPLASTSPSPVTLPGLPMFRRIPGIPGIPSIGAAPHSTNDVSYWIQTTTPQTNDTSRPTSFDALPTETSTHSTMAAPPTVASSPPPFTVSDNPESFGPPVLRGRTGGPAAPSVTRRSGSAEINSLVRQYLRPFCPIPLFADKLLAFPEPHQQLDTSLTSNPAALNYFSLNTELNSSRPAASSSPDPTPSFKKSALEAKSKTKASKSSTKKSTKSKTDSTSTLSKDPDETSDETPKPSKKKLTKSKTDSASTPTDNLDGIPKSSTKGSTKSKTDSTSTPTNESDGTPESSTKKSTKSKTDSTPTSANEPEGTPKPKKAKAKPSASTTPPISTPEPSGTPKSSTAKPKSAKNQSGSLSSRAKYPNGTPKPKHARFGLSAAGTPHRKYRCTECIRKKVGCDRNLPCSSCVRKEAECVYEHAPPLTRTREDGVKVSVGGDGEDGEDGEGEDGKGGEDGKDGEDGRDGEDGKEGEDGKDGED